MTEIEAQALEKYIELLAGKTGITSELIDAIASELAQDNPNTERLAEILRRG